MIDWETVVRGCVVSAYICAALWMMLGLPQAKGALTRREKWFLAVLAATLPLSVLMIFLLGMEGYSQYYPLFVMLPVYAATWIVPAYRGFKRSFVFLTALVWVAPLLLAASTGAMLFPGLPWIRLMMNVAVGVPMLVLLRRLFLKPLHYLLNHFSKGWALFCAVPFLVVVMGYHQTRYRFTYDIESFRSSYVWLYTLSALGFLSYFLIVHYAQQIRSFMEAQSDEQLLKAQLQGALQYAHSLRQSQRQAARYEHDLRHHLQHISTMAAQNDTLAIRDYVAQIEGSITEVSPKRFCGNETVNLILSAYQAKAAKAGVRLTVRADIPKTLAVSDTDLCVILSNALENALRAAAEAGADAGAVAFVCKTKNEQLLIQISNPYAGKIRFENGVPAGQDGKGIGVKSICLAVEGLGGMVSFDAAEGRFTLRIIV